MHVLVIPSWYPTERAPYNGTFFRDQSLAMKEYGHKVGIVALDGVGILPVSGWSRLREGFRVSEDSGMVVIQDSAPMILPKVPGGNTAWLAHRILRLVRTYVDHHGRPDVVHVHSLLPAGYAALLLKRRQGIPFIVTEHRSAIAHRISQSGDWRHARQIVEEAGGLVGCSLPFTAVLDGILPPPQGGWSYIPGLLGEQFEAATVVRRSHEDPFVFGHVSLLDPTVKRVPVLLEAFAHAFNKDPSTILRIVGDSVHLPDLRRLAQQLDISKQVRFAGFVSRDRIVEEFQGFDAFVLSSSREAFATVIWEALSLGVPVISTRNDGGINALEGHPELGALVPIDDVEALSHAMVRMRTERSLYNSDAIRDYAIESSSQQAFASKYTAIYENAVAGAR